MKFCPYCNSQVDRSDKFCPMCGKKVKLENNKRINTALLIFTCILLISTIFLSYITLFQYGKMHIINEDSQCNAETASTYEKTIDELKEKKDKYESLSCEYYDKYKHKADYLDEYIAIVTETGKTYHTIDCPLIQDADAWYVYGVADAKQVGYEPCTTCNNGH